MRLCMRLLKSPSLLARITVNSRHKVDFDCKGRYFATQSNHSRPPPVWGSKKFAGKAKRSLQAAEIMDPQIEALLEPLRAMVKEQGDLVRQMKGDGANELDVKKAVAELKARKKVLEDKELELRSAEETFDRPKLEDLLKRRFYYHQSFSIHGGVSGLYDFGPIGAGVKRNLLSLWESFFVHEENMLEVDTVEMTPEPVLKASGHVDKFADLMVKDVKNGECFRLDHLIKAQLQKVMADKKTTAEVKARCEDLLIKLDNFGAAEMDKILKEFNMKSPITGNDLSEPLEFNLMFQTQIGPTGQVRGFLRPETAQGIFVNFKSLLEYNQGRLPFAAAQIGKAFRVKERDFPALVCCECGEFTMAEIEHFCDPKDKNHPKFDSVRHIEALFYSACNQMDGKSVQKFTFGEAVDGSMIANQTLGYFMARIQMFMIKIGIDPKKIRFRQHMSNEMAHYACDCWDVELLTSYGWVECVGCADRSAYDLTQHAKATGVKLCAEKALPAPITKKVVELVPDKGQLGKSFRKDAGAIMEYLSGLEAQAVEDIYAKITSQGEVEVTIADGRAFKLTKSMIPDVRRYDKTVCVEEIVPSVIEPSFGIGRIMYSLFEHSFRIRPDNEQRTYLSLPAIMAPIKCSVLPLSGNDEFAPFIQKLAADLTAAQVRNTVDDSGASIGKRYARTDELAIPFGICVDFDSLKAPHTVTVRERDSTLQVRMPLEDVTRVLHDLSTGKMTWEAVMATYPKFTQQEATTKSS